MRSVITGLLALWLFCPAQADEPKKPSKAEEIPPPAKEGEKTPAMKPEEPAQEEESPPLVSRPPVEFILTPGEARATPYKKGVAYANGGVIDVAQPNPTTLVVTMSGLTATNADLACKSVAQYTFDLMQCFEIRFNAKRVKTAKLFLEGRVIGLLRSDHSHYTGCLCKVSGTADTHAACATVNCGAQEIIGLTMPARATACREDLSVYNHEGPFCVQVVPGTYTLHESWGFGTTHPAFFCRGASAEFSPQPQYCPEGADAYWFAHFRPFNGQATKDFGFQLTLKLVPE